MRMFGMKTKLGIYTITLAVSALAMLSCGGGDGTSNSSTALPYLGEKEAVTRVENGQEIVDTLYHTIPDFVFLNQDSVLVDQHFFEGSVYVANFFFTHCPTICPTMQRNLLDVYQAYLDDYRVKFLSHTIDFKYDQPSVLKNYANRLGVVNDQWQFVTGSKADIYGISPHYLSYAAEEESVPGGYEHSGYLVLVDQNRHIRGAYDGTSKEDTERLRKDIARLLQEK